MTSSDPRWLLPVLLLAAACGGGSSAAPASPGNAGNTGGTGGTPPNVVAVSVDGPGCSAGAYFNEPCVSVKVCVPGTSNCQVIDDLLLDTGSVGLRVFSQVLTLPLPAVSAAGGASVAECLGYMDGSTQWGPVLRAGVVLGDEPAVEVPIQRIDASYAGAPAACSGAQSDPASAGFNGILGVGFFEQDCGPGCTATNNGMYFACSGASCAPTALGTASQVQNPVAALPVDNNGLVVRLPAVPAAGAAAAAGELLLGIGTRSNNVPPASVRGYPLDGNGEFRTTLGGVTVPAFVDTGSNGLFFAPPAGSGLVGCAAPSAGWFCPASLVAMSATNAGVRGTPSSKVDFEITSLDALASTAAVSSAVGGAGPAGSSFDWGLPFYFGRDVYVGFESHTSGLGAGPVVGY